MRWYAKEGPVRDPAAPTVAVLLYRKHVITDQARPGSVKRSVQKGSLLALCPQRCERQSAP